VGADLPNVLVAGYSNGYIHYVTTPEEYDAQRYEGGSTLFGRWEAPALTQVAVELATAMRDGTVIDRGARPPDLSAGQRAIRQPTPDHPIEGYVFGDVINTPLSFYRAGEQARAVFAGANPDNDLRRGRTFLAVERHVEGKWQRVADDGDWSTKLHWAGVGKAGSRITVTWDVTDTVEPGTYRLRYYGDVANELGGSSPIVGVTAPFAIVDVDA
jgi:neutral ceramidase